VRMKKAMGLFLVIGLVLLGVMWLVNNDDPNGQTGEQSMRTGLLKNRGARVEAGRRYQKGSPKHRAGDSVPAGNNVRERVIVFDEAESEELALSEHIRTVLKQLQDALDKNDFESVKQLVTKLQEIAHAANAESAMPKILRRKAIEALGWFGSKAVPELVGYLGDPDPEISADAQAQLELALQDVDLADYEIAEIVLQLTRIVNDSDAVDSYFMELTKMRNSVMIDTIIGICQDGNEVALSKVAENLKFLTGDDSLATVEDARQWLAENPDGPDDDYFYGNKESSSNPEMVSVKVDVEEYLAEQEKLSREFEEYFRARELQEQQQELLRQQEVQQEVEIRERESMRQSASTGENVQP